MKKAFLLLAACQQLAMAATVGFRVIAPNGTDVQVSINGQQTKLNAQDADVPYFTGQADLPANAKYKVS